MGTIKQAVHERLSDYDNKLRQSYGQNIVGVDECGRGAFAGPLAASAVIFPPDVILPGVNDSKRLSMAKRNELAPLIKATALAWHVEMVSAAEIDEKGIQWANRYAMVVAAKKATEKLAEAHQEAVALYVVDQSSAGFTLQPFKMTPKADALSLSVAAASILAKTTRDSLMEELDLQYPVYQWKSNFGYVCSEHIDAVRRHGLVGGLHRKTYKIKALSTTKQTTLDDF